MNSPEIQIGLELFYIAFLDLTTCRGQGYGTEGPIDWVSMRDYCDEYEIFGSQREDLYYHIQRLDAAYLNHKAERLEKLSKPRGK